MMENCDDANAKNAKDLYNLGISLYNSGKNHEAVHYFEKAINVCLNDSIKQKDNLFPQLWYNKGLALFNLSKYKEAVDCLEEADKYSKSLNGHESFILGDGNKHYIWYNKGLAYNSLQKYKNAIECFDKAIKEIGKDHRLNEDLALTLYNKGLALGNSKRYGEASECFTRIIDHNIYTTRDQFLADVYRNKGFTLARLKNSEEETIRSFDEALKIDPYCSLILNSKGYTLTILGEKDSKQNTEHFKSAIECFDRAIEIDPGLASAWRNKGNALKSLAKYGGVADYDDAKKIDSYFNSALHANGYDHHTHEDVKQIIRRILYEDAIKYIDVSIQIYKNHTYPREYKNHAYAWEYKHHAYAWNYKGYVFFEFASLYNKDSKKKSERYEESVKCFNEAIKLDSENAYAWNYKGLALFNLTKYEECVKCFNEAIIIYNKDIEEDPENVEAWHNLGYAWNCKGISLDRIAERGQDAVKCFDEAIKSYKKVEPLDITLDIAIELADALHNKGYALGKLGKKEKDRYYQAIECFDYALNIKKNEKEKLEGINRKGLQRSLADSYRNKGFVLFMLESYQDAIKHYELAIAEDPAFPLAWNGLGYLILNSAIAKDDTHDRAIREYYESLIDTNKSNDDIDNNKNVLEYEKVKKEYIIGNKGIYDIALLCFDNGIKTDEDGVYAFPHYNKGYVYYIQGRESEKNEKHFDEGTKNKNSESLFKKADDSFKAALNINPNSSIVLNYKGYALNSKGDVLKSEGDYFQAIDCYYEAIRCFKKAEQIESESDPEVATIEIKASSDYASKARGYALYSVERHKDALEFFGKAVKKDPCDYESHYYEGNAVFNLEKYEEAIECYNNALDRIDEINRKNKSNNNEIDQNLKNPIFLNRGEAKYKIGKYSEALDDFEEIIKRKDPKLEGQAHNNKGLCYHRKNFLYDAEQEYLKASNSTDQKLTSSMAYYNLGILYGNRSEAEKAKSMFELCYDSCHDSKTTLLEDADKAIRRLENTSQSQYDWISWWFDNSRRPKSQTDAGKRSQNSDDPKGRFTINIRRPAIGITLFLSAIAFIAVIITTAVILDMHPGDIKDGSNIMTWVVVTLFLILFILILPSLLPVLRKVKVAGLEMDTVSSPVTHIELNPEDSGKYVIVNMPIQYHPLESYVALVRSEDLNKLHFIEPFLMPLQNPIRCFSLPYIPSPSR
jgi:tetratricopeptide (TPR) repeat protein